MSCLTFDSWFATPAQITDIKSRGIDVIAMIKKSSRIKYEYCGKQLNIKEIYSQNKKRRGRSKYLLSVDVKVGKEEPIAAKIVCREGAVEIYAVSSHGLFADKAAELLDNSPIREILVTDSVDTKEKTPKNLHYITASELIGDAIVRIQERKPVSPLFAYQKK